LPSPSALEIISQLPWEKESSCNKGAKVKMILEPKFVKRKVMAIFFEIFP